MSARLRSVIETPSKLRFASRRLQPRLRGAFDAERRRPRTIGPKFARAPPPKSFERDRIAATLSVVSWGLGRLSGRRLHEVDERRIGADTIAQGAADGLELDRAQVA
jgi:hypothetical protein